MNRIGRIAAIICVGVFAVVLAMLVVWASFVIAVSVAAAIYGRLGEAIGAFIAAGLLFAGCLFAAHAAVMARGFVERQRGNHRQQAIVRSLDALRADPLRIHWLPLAERSFLADSAVVEEWERRYQQLLADPLRRGWADLALRGEFPSNEEIDYQRDPSVLMTCAHLQALERDLRASAEPMRLLRPLSVESNHAFDGQRLIERYALQGITWNVPEYDPRDPNPGWLYCKACDSCITSGYGAPFPSG